MGRDTPCRTDSCPRNPQRPRSRRRRATPPWRQTDSRAGKVPLRLLPLRERSAESRTANGRACASDAASGQTRAKGTSADESRPCAAPRYVLVARRGAPSSRIFKRFCSGPVRDGRSDKTERFRPKRCSCAKRRLAKAGTAVQIWPTHPSSAMVSEGTPTRVQLHLYDLSQGMARVMSAQLLGKQLDGIRHTGIVAYGQEFISAEASSAALPDAPTSDARSR